MPKSARSINKQNNWVYALGQIIKRMDIKRIFSSGAHKGEVNYAYKYGIAFCNESAWVAFYTIPYKIARVLNLYIFSANEYGEVVQFTPSNFGKKHELQEFFLHSLEEYGDLFI